MFSFHVANVFALPRRMFADDSLCVCVWVQRWGMPPLFFSIFFLLTVALCVLFRLQQSWITSSHQCYSAEPKTPLSPAAGLHSHFLPAAGLHHPHRRPHHTQTQVQRSGETSPSKNSTDLEIYVNIIRAFVLSVFYPQPSTRWATVTQTHTSAPLKHTLRCVFLLLPQVWEKLRALWDGFSWGDRVQPGGQKHWWGASPPERQGQVCPHYVFKSHRLVCVSRLQEQPAERESSSQLSTKGHRSWQRWFIFKLSACLEAIALI